jgi:hypothetical protein
MSKGILMLTMAGLGLAGLTLVPRASADEWDQKTFVTLNAPAELPGIVLAPGTYTFKLADSLSDRDIVQVFNKDETKLYTTTMGIPVYRLTPTDHTVITFEERPAGTPEAIKDWYYPGSNYGVEFLYAKQPFATAQVMPPRRIETAARASATPASPASANTPPSEQAASKTPEATKPIEVAQLPQPVPAAPAAAPAAPSAAPSAEKGTKHLPRTASDYPLFGVLGLFSLGAAGALRLFARRSA